MKILSIISILTLAAFIYDYKQPKLTAEAVDFYYCHYQANLLDNCKYNNQ